MASPLRRSGTVYITSLAADEADDLRAEGRRDGPLFMLNTLFPSAVHASEGDASEDTPHYLSLSGSASPAELAGRLLWKKKVLPPAEWWGRFSAVLLSVAEYRGYDSAEASPHLSVALDAVGRWVERVAEEEPERLYLFFSERGAFAEHADEFVRRVPSCEALVENLFYAIGLDQEEGDASLCLADNDDDDDDAMAGPARLAPSRLAARLCASLLLDDAADANTRSRSGMALSRFGPDLLRPYGRELQGVVDGTLELQTGIALPRRVKWAATKALLRVWQADGRVAERVAERDGEDRSMLARAAHEGNSRLVALLLECGASADDLDAERRTPLILAARAGHSAAVRELLRGGADREAEDRHEMTAAQYAAANGDGATVAVLAEAGADLERADSRGRTALLLAAQDGNTEAVTALVEAGCDRGATDANGRTALMLAAASGGGSTVNELLRLGFDLTLVDDDRRNALMLAAEHGRVDAARSLLTVVQRARAAGRRWVGFSVDQASVNGMTALMFAAASGSHFVCRLLLEAGADPAVLDRPVAGRTALRYATKGGHKEAARVIREHEQRIERWEESDERAQERYYARVLDEEGRRARLAQDASRPVYDAVDDAFNFTELLRHAWTA